ncbi:MAG: hypothetical protein D6718_08115 [Acidobacteria bacterium]|nr:MAG: hypothetical protein D6718_08115 [Acidobacteriota bacterium]
MSDRRAERRRQWAAAGIAAAILAASLLTFGRYVLPRRWSRTPTPAAAASRGSTEPGPADLEPIDRTSRRVSAERGGELSAPGGLARLRIPPGGLPRDTTVTIVRYRDHHPADLTGFVYDLRPEGLQLTRPARFEMALPPGVQPEEAEIAVYDPATGAWTAEPAQEPTEDGDGLAARLAHFSLRRIRIRPGMNFPYDPHRGRATFYLESDAGNTFERYIEGRWRAVRRRTRAYRDLMRLQRAGRHELILSGRLRAVTGPRPRPEVFEDERRTVAMPAGVPEARTGWVRVRRLDAAGRPTGQEVVARVNDYGPGPEPRRAGVIVDLSRAAAEALGLVWGRDFGLAEDNPNLAWIRLDDPATGRRLRYVPVAVEAYDPRPPRAHRCRLW